MHRSFLAYLVVSLASVLLAAPSFGQQRLNQYGSSHGFTPLIPPLGRYIPPPHSNYGSGRAHRYPSVFAYPVYIGDYGSSLGSGYYGGTASAPAGDPSADAAPAPPPVVINQYFSGVTPQADSDPGPQQDPNIRYYNESSGQQQTGVAPAADESRSYLIAYKDHSIYSALAYWIEGNTLHYVTTQNTHNQADLSLIDVDTTTRLNQDRLLPFTVNR